MSYEVFKKPYYDTTFLSFLINNEDLIKQNFGENTNYNDILEKIDYKEISKKKEELFNIIKVYSDKVNIIIDSFYYLLFYKFKDIKEKKGQTNIGNVYINTILTKFVDFLSSNLNISLIDLLYELYSFDLEKAKYKENEKIEKFYTFDDIEKKLSSCGQNLKAAFEFNKLNYSKIFKGCVQIFDSIRAHAKDSEDFYFFYLKSNNDKFTSNTITIIIDIFSREESEKEWTNFIKYFDKKTKFIFLKWSYYLKKNFIEKEREKHINNSKNLSKASGVFLAEILISKKIFKDYQINLVCYNFGANVVKSCLKELNVFNNKNNFIKFKNIILIGAATHFKHEEKWKEIIKNNVIDRFINCYSGCDEKLKNLYSKVSVANKSKKPPIGINALELKDENNNNLIENYDFTNAKYDQLSYDFEKVAQKIFPNNKAL